MRGKVVTLIGVVVLSVLSSFITWQIVQHLSRPEGDFLSPLLEIPTAKPLQQYSIPNLSQRQYAPSHITIEKELKKTDTYTSYVFSYITLDKKMTGQLNIPATPLPGNPAIVMLRGYVPSEIFETGVGTRNGAAVLAENGFITVAPDFFSYGGSDPEPNDSWQARFEKPITVIELIKTLELEPLPAPLSIKVGKVGLWGHSNGGQIAISSLEILGTSLPTTLWAPVTAPFPYSLLYFSDENPDEGKEMRKWISIFEKDYDVFDFSLTRHLDRLKGPLQIHHGTNDDSSLKAWDDEFVAKIEVENERRATELKNAATESASIDKSALEPIEVEYFVYPGADHNMQPSWQTVIDRDVEFFKKYLSN